MKFTESILAMVPNPKEDHLNPKQAVYTALLGGYEDLSKQPVAVESGIPFICFTDSSDLRSDTWQIVRVEPDFPLDLVRSQRSLKIRGHAALAEFDETLYIDNSVELKAGPAQILAEWLRNHDLAISAHSYRDHVIDEFDEVVALQYDDQVRVYEQLMHYAELYGHILEQKPYWNGIIARRNTETVADGMSVWFDHVLRYSRRDQLSANVAFYLADLAVNLIERDNFESEWHKWPVDVNRRVALGKTSGIPSGPLLAELARQKRVNAELLERTSRELADERARLTSEVQEAENTRMAAQRYAEEVASEFRASLSWKVTGPLRAARSLARRIRRN